MNVYRSFHVTETGGSHIKAGKGCEDYSLHSDQPAYSVAVVSDGHGDDNCFRSAKGAELAAEYARGGIVKFAAAMHPQFAKTFFKVPKPPEKAEFEKSLRDLIKHIVASWRVKVEEDYTARPFAAEELAKADEKHRTKYEAGKSRNKAYGATLIAAAITEHYWFGIHIGDGRFTALYEDGTFDQPVPWDERCYLNVTTSICDDDSADAARCYCSYHADKPPPVAVFLCSDGVDDNYPVDGNGAHLFKLYRTIALTFAEDGFDSTCGQLKDLANSFATKGKGDDTSIAGFIDMEGVQRAVPVWKKQIAEEEAAARGLTPNASDPPASYGEFVSAPKETDGEAGDA